MNNITGFQRMRRLQAAKQAAENQKQVHDVQPAENVLDVSKLSFEDVKRELDKLGIKYPHNAGEDNLRGKLQDALNG